MPVGIELAILNQFGTQGDEMTMVMENNEATNRELTKLVAILEYEQSRVMSSPYTIPNFRGDLLGKGFLMERVTQDFELRLKYGDAFTEDYAILFYNIYAQNLPHVPLGTIALSYNSDVELEWDE